jgi:hypothetical protein
MTCTEGRMEPVSYGGGRRGETTVAQQSYGVRGRRRSGRADSGRRRCAPVLRQRSFGTAALQLARENTAAAALTRRRRRGLDSEALRQGSSFGQELRSGSFMPARAAGGCRTRWPMEARHLATESPNRWAPRVSDF